VTGSAGASYLWQQTRFSTDLLFGSGLRASVTLPDGSAIPNGTHLPYYTQVNAAISHVFHLSGDGTLTARADVDQRVRPRIPDPQRHRGGRRRAAVRASPWLLLRPVEVAINWRAGNITNKRPA